MSACNDNIHIDDICTECGDVIEGESNTGDLCDSCFWAVWGYGC